jgi:class 3 adenylate cyclase
MASETMNHRDGQYRAQLFEEIVGCLLTKIFVGSKIQSNFVVPQAWLDSEASKRAVDFLITEPSGSSVVVETKAPYDENLRVLGKNPSDLNAFLRHWQKSTPVHRFIFAIAAELSPSMIVSFDSHALAMPQLELWDASKINDLLVAHFSLKLKTFSAEDMATVLAQIRDEARVMRMSDFPVSDEIEPISRKSAINGLIAHVEEDELPFQSGEARLREGIHQKVVVLFADFCSYSKFVRASGDDHELVAAIMRRFYRDTRKSIQNHDGVIDKYMGDGILAFWMPKGDGTALPAAITACIHELIGIGLKLANEWQMHVDSSVNPTGMTCGAAIGTVQLISENQDGLLPIHAVGDAINMASRLQAEAKPNTLIISNKLKTEYFPQDDTFVGIQRNPKNIGEVDAWEKDYLIETELGLMRIKSEHPTR